MTRSAICALLALFALSACNTVEGLGQDVSSGGEVLTGTADDVQSDM